MFTPQRVFAHNDVPLICDAAAAYALVMLNRIPSVAFDQNAESSTVTFALFTNIPLPCCAAPTNPFFSDFVLRITNAAADPVVPPNTPIPESALWVKVESSIVTVAPFTNSIAFASDTALPPP